MSPSMEILAFNCPRCGGDLDGLCTDEMFVCRHCVIAVQFRLGTDPIIVPLYFAQPLDPAPGMPPQVYLPFWRCHCDVTILCPDEKRLVRARQAVCREMWLTAARVRGIATYGNLGLRLTEAGPEIELASTVPVFAGIGLCLEHVREILEFQVMAYIDKRVDITDMELSVSMTDCQLTGIPFYISGNNLIDALTGISIPSATVEDLPALLKYISKSQ